MYVLMVRRSLTKTCNSQETETDRDQVKTEQFSLIELYHFVNSKSQSRGIERAEENGQERIPTCTLVFDPVIVI
jgi:hypothetical protein